MTTIREIEIVGRTSGGVRKTILTGEDGEILNSAYFGDVIIEAPGVNDTYQPRSGTINNGLSNVLIAMGNVTTGYGVLIKNKTSNTVITMKLGGTGNESINIENDTSLGIFGKRISNQKFTSIHLSNASGENVDYEIDIYGV